jgi:positive regulator of sigma E activity
MAFTIVFIQELVQGKGVVVGLQEGDPVNQAVLGALEPHLGFDGLVGHQGQGRLYQTGIVNGNSY